MNIAREKIMRSKMIRAKITTDPSFYQNRIASLAPGFIQWNKAALGDKIIHNRNVTICMYGDDNIFERTSRPLFKSENVFMFYCSQKFVHHWLDRITFPNINSVYFVDCGLDDHVFKQGIPEIYLEEMYRKKLDSNYLNLCNVKLISGDEINNILDKHKIERLRITDKF